MTCLLNVILFLRIFPQILHSWPTVRNSSPDVSPPGYRENKLLADCVRHPLILTEIIQINKRSSLEIQSTKIIYFLYKPLGRNQQNLYHTQPIIIKKINATNYNPTPDIYYPTSDIKFTRNIVGNAATLFYIPPNDLVVEFTEGQFLRPVRFTSSVILTPVTDQTIP